MNALGDVNCLCNPQIGSNAAERVGVLRRKPRELAYQHNHISERLFHGVIEVLVEGHGDPTQWRFGARAFQREVLAEMKFDPSGEGGLDRSETDLAVTLQGVAVPE